MNNNMTLFLDIEILWNIHIYVYSTVILQQDIL